ncbi:MAG: invasion associated locus B family protein [Rhodospirillum sp.]|nr:invasion associated locus B family protein [Rhodospirillum sp.]MCF8491698.1 invasion associated locus B family protein [Rhodospirillum sp.]MCF8502646.1 invasion associated locus B family protein [Rhodospirillum sp.]
MRKPVNPIAVIALAFGLGLVQTGVGPASAAPPKPAAKPAASEEPQVTTESFGDWLLRCVTPPGEAKNCEVVQTIQVQGQPAPLAQLALGRAPGDSALTMTVVVAVNVAFFAPVNIQIDETLVQPLDWTRCVPGACFATSGLNNAVAQDFRQHQGEGKLEYHTADGETLGIPLSWRGLDGALKAMDAARKSTANR